MRVFLDENIDPDLIPYLAEFEVSSVALRGWHSVSNGELLKLIESEFDVLLSHDRGLEFQQRWAGRQLGLVVLYTPSNRFETYKDSVQTLLEIVGRSTHGVVQRFEVGA